jgi:hypothetical protein
MARSTCLLSHAGINDLSRVPATRLSRTEITELNGFVGEYTYRGALKRASLAFDVALSKDEISPASIARRHCVLSSTMATLKHLVVHSHVFLTTVKAERTRPASKASGSKILLKPIVNPALPFVAHLVAP